MGCKTVQEEDTAIQINTRQPNKGYPKNQSNQGCPKDRAIPYNGRQIQDKTKT